MGLADLGAFRLGSSHRLAAPEAQVNALLGRGQAFDVSQCGCFAVPLGTQGPSCRGIPARRATELEREAEMPDSLQGRPAWQKVMPRWRFQRLRDWLVFVLTEFEFYAAVALGAAALWSLHWPKLVLLALPPPVMWRIARLSKDTHDDLYLLAACYIVWVALGVIWLWLFTRAD